MAFNAIDNTRVNAAKHQDDWYAAEVVAGKEVPYASLAAAYAAIPSAVRMNGRSFIVTENGATVEYWFKDNDFVNAVPKGGTAPLLANESAAPISRYFKNGKVYANFANGDTGELFSIFESVNKFSGVPITDADVDYKLYFKFTDGKYGIRHFPHNVIDITEIGAKDSLDDDNTGFDNTEIIRKAKDYLTKRFKEAGGTVFIPKTSATRSFKLTVFEGVSYLTYKGEGRSKLQALPSSETGLFKMMDSPMREFHMEGIQLIPNAANTTQHGLDLTSSTAFSTYNTGGFWYSKFIDVMAFGFGGNCLNLVSIDVAGQGDKANQFSIFDNCKFEAKSGSATSRAMFVRGQFGQVKYIQCQFDGAGSDVVGSCCIEMISVPGANGTDNIYSIDFDTCTSQRSDYSVIMDQARARFQNFHTEQIKKVFWAKNLSRLTIDGNSEIGSSGGQALSDGVEYYTVRNSSSYVSMLGNQLKAGYFVNDSAYSFVVSASNFSQTAIRIGTKGFTRQRGLTTDGILSGIAANKNILLTLTNQDFSNISSQIITGEQLTVTGFGGTSAYVRLSTADNLYIPSRLGSSLIIRNGDVAIFEKIDLPNEGYKLINFISNERWGTTFPATGTWFANEVVNNSAYVDATTPLKWICVASAVVDSGGVVTTQAVWRAIYDQDYGRPSDMTQESISGSTLTFRNRDLLLNTNNATLATISEPTQAYVKAGYPQRFRVWEVGGTGVGTNFVQNSYIKLVNTGNIVLPKNQTEIILRSNEVVTMVWNNFAGKWALQSIGKQRNEGLSFPITGYWFKGETVYNTDPGTNNVFAWVNTVEGFASRGLWSAGLAVVAAEQRTFGSNIYRANTTGTTGSTPPTHTTGGVTDGNIVWTYLGNVAYNISPISIVNKGGSKTVTSATTLALSDYGSNGQVTVYLDASGGPFTLTLLPSATDLGLTTNVVKTDASANTITVKGNGTELINNANTDTTLSTQNASFILKSNGTKHFKF